MIIFMLIGLGLCFGSFVNALVWRVHEQDKPKRKTKASKKKAAVTASDLSVVRGRSMCPDCRHTLHAGDLIPVLSWLSLRGQCRYCRKPISWQYPLVELLTAALFVASYIWWPQPFNATGVTNFMFWCVMLIGFMALFVYDLKWMLLPNRIVYPLIALAGVLASLNILVFNGGMRSVSDLSVSILIAFGLFYALFELSKGKWIGGGDVKLGLIIGLSIMVPIQSFLVLFLASLIGTLVILPGLASKKLKATSRIPFGPFLIVATIIVKLFGASVISWYRHKFLLF